MIVTSLELHNFRSYDNLHVEFVPKINMLIGKNGTGKTNLAESIYLLSLCKSWRNNDIRSLLKWNEDAAFVRARVAIGNGLPKTIEILLTSKGKKITIDNKPIRRLSELSEIVNIVLFSPEDVDLMRGSPSLRRSFLDVSICKESSAYLYTIGKYEKLLTERNIALKRNDVDLNYLNVVTEQMIDVSEHIIARRSEYVARLNKILSGVANELYDENNELKIVYKPFIKADNFKQAAKSLYERNLQNDLLHKTTSIGVHREDFSVLLNGNDIAVYGSQGENRLAAIALKMAPYFLIEDEAKKPIAILDDVYSELDDAHSQRLAKLLKSLGQVFVTSAEELIDGDVIFDISKNHAKRRN